MNRPHKIGASDAKTIAFGSDEDLIEMANRIREGKEMKFNKNHRFLMDLGTAVEPVTMKRFNDDVTTLADEQVTLSWDQDKRVGCILDGCLEGPEGVSALSGLLARQPPDAIVRLRFHGPTTRERGRLPLRTETLRGLAPKTMNVSVRWTEDPTWRLET